MKTIFKSALLFTATTALFSSCVKDNTFENENSIEKTIIVTATASAPNNNDTRVSVGEKDGNTYPFYWNENDKLSIYSYYLNSDNSNTYIKSLSNIAITVSEDYTKATFSFEDTAKESTKYTYRAGYPSARVTNIFDNTYGKDAVCILDDVQIPTATSVDPNAVLLFAETETEIQGDDITFTFEHIVAYGKMTVTGPSVANGETVKSVRLSTDQNIAGNFNYYWAEQPVRYDIKTPKTSITTDLSAQNIDANSVFTVWFAVLPSSTSNFSITIETDEHTYTKTISGKSLTFLQGRVSTFNVDMTSAECSELTTIADGDYVILALNGSKYYAAAGVEGSNKYLSYAEFDGYTGSEENVTTGNTDIIWTITNVSGNTYTVQHNDSGNYLYYKISGTSPANEAFLGDSSELTIEPNDNGETYQIKTSDRTLAYNTSSPRFAFYASLSNTIKGDLYLIPVKSVPNITVEQSELNVAADGDTDEMTVTVTNHTGTVTVDITYDNGDGWVDAEWDKNVLTYLIDENKDETPRTAYITIKASNENGEASKSITVNQSGKGAVTYVYKKITSTTELTNGEYLIVYEGGNVAFNGNLTTLDATNNTINVTINDGKIEATSTTDAAAFTIATSEGAYTIKSASGYYIGMTKDDNSLASNTSSSYNNTISFVDNDADIISSSAHLRYNATSGQTRFRYFKSGTYTSQKAIQLYKKIDGSNTGGGTEPEPEQPEQPEQPGDETSTTTFDYSTLGKTDGTSANDTSWSLDGITLSYAKNNGQTNPAYYSGTIRLYASNKLTIDAGNATITKIEFTTDGTNYTTSNFSEMTANNNNVWTGNASNVSFTVSSGQVRIKSIAVTYEK